MCVSVRLHKFRFNDFILGKKYCKRYGFNHEAMLVRSVDNIVALTADKYFFFSILICGGFVQIYLPILSAFKFSVKILSSFFIF